MRIAIKHAISSKDGIVIFSNIIPIIGVETYYDEEDRIKCRHTRGYPKSVTYEAIQPSYRVRDLNMLILFILLVLQMHTVYTFNMPLFIALCVFIIRRGYEEYSAITVWLIEHKLKCSYGRNVARFHSAEHMALKAFEKRNLIPTIEEIKKESRFANECGSMDTFNGMFCKTFFSITMYFCVKSIFSIVDQLNALLINQEIGYIVYGFDIMVAIFGVMIIYISAYLIISMVVVRYSLMKFLQVLVTSPPTDREIILAQKAIENYLLLEKSILEGIVYSSEPLDEYDIYGGKHV